MANDKGGSDLDVFEGLTKKPGARPSLPPSTPTSRPGGPPSGLPLPPPGPPRERPKTMLGIAPPPGMSSGLPPLAPPPSKPSTLPTSSKSTTLGFAPPGPPPSLQKLPPVAPPLSRPPTGLPPVSVPPVANLPPPTTPAAKANSVVDMDWDDEDEKTNIYDKEETQKDLERVSGRPLPAAGMPAPKPNLGTAAALAAGSGGAATNPLPAPLPLPPPAPLPLPSTTRAPTPPPGTLPAVSAQPASRFESTQVVAPQQSGGKGGMIAGIAVLVVAAAGAFFLLQPKNGNLIVSIKNKTDGRTIDAAKVEIDSKVVCEKTPCKVSDLLKGAHVVKASAPGFEANDLPVTIRAGEDSTIILELMPVRETTTVDAPKLSGTGFKATGPAHIKVALDGKDIGPLPQEVKDSTPGAHKVKFYSTERYQPDERSITFNENKIEDLGVVKLKVLKGKATITLETAGAAVTLVSGTERRAIPQFPISIDIDTSKVWTIEAKRFGFEDFKLPISFDDGEAEKTFAVSLLKKGEKKADPVKTETTKTDPVTKPAETTTTKVDPPATNTGTATLNINSVPPSNAILDGRPLGQTPKPGVSVSAGTHTVIFVHPEKGRKTQTISVKGGETKTVVVRF